MSEEFNLSAQRESISKDAEAVLKLFVGKNSSASMLSVLSAIEFICTHELATNEFKQATAILLEEQALRVRASMIESSTSH